MSNVWTSKDTSKATKLKVYETMILSVIRRRGRYRWQNRIDSRFLRCRVCARLKEWLEETASTTKRRSSVGWSTAEYSNDVFNIAVMCTGVHCTMGKLALDGYIHGKQKQGRAQKQRTDGVTSDCDKMGNALCWGQRHHSRAAIACSMSIAKAPSQSQDVKLCVLAHSLKPASSY